MYRFGYAEGTYRNVLSEAWNDRWSSENPDGSYPRLGYSSNLFAAAMDRFIEDGSYLRLNSLTLNYDIDLRTCVSLFLISSSQAADAGVNADPISRSCRYWILASGSSYQPMR